MGPDAVLNKVIAQGDVSSTLQSEVFTFGLNAAGQTRWDFCIHCRTEGHSGAGERPVDRVLRRWLGAAEKMRAMGGIAPAGGSGVRRSANVLLRRLVIPRFG